MLIALLVIGTYLMIGSLIALWGYLLSLQEDDRQDPLVNSLTFLMAMVFWPGIFGILWKIIFRKRDRGS